MWAAIIGWLNEIAAVVGPLSIVIGFPGAAIGSIVGVVKVRKWATTTLVPAQEATREAANRAETAARGAESASQAAATHAETASQEAKTAGANSKQAAGRLDIVGHRLKDVLDDRDLATRLDDLLTAYLRLRSIARDAGLSLPTDLDPPHVDLERTQALTSITGRHILSPHR